MGRKDQRQRGTMALKRKILLVDDEHDFLTALADRLEADGFSVARAQNGRQALDQIAAFSPDLILMDFQMPLMNGLEALRAIRKLDHPPPVIMITGDTRSHLPSLLLKAGAMGCLRKPFEYEILKAQIEQALRFGGSSAGSSGHGLGGPP